ncbi:MAG: hypothetical protein IPJ13_16015 [Saprospiraceae bacterium]|nr:hypothetical protein [Saprospiraceae bacterium]
MEQESYFGTTKPKNNYTGIKPDMDVTTHNIQHHFAVKKQIKHRIFVANKVYILPDYRGYLGQYIYEHKKLDIL